MAVNILEGLNPQQLEAATHLDGPLLILAGAGSGKTRVLTNRIAWLMGEKGIKPWNICAITFTNKAAGEMRARVDHLAGFGAEAVNVATFHSTCVRILRRFIDRIGYQTNFDIYDSDDSKSLMKDICRSLDVNTKLYKERMFLSRISHAKDELTGPEEYRKAADDREEAMVARVYAEYQSRLRRSNALDFDDLIGLTVRLFREDKEVLAYYQERWRYILVDEYQDTNKAQFVLISLLAEKYRNLCVVGDDDQSIYKFRGADIRNILDFENHFPETKVIRLEQNYRSTQNILDVANAVIANNQSRKAKRLWTSNGAGELITVKSFDTARDEADYIVRDIVKQKKQKGFDLKQSAVLYRTNAQSRQIEERLLYENVPYTIIGGVNFYSRKEIKDVLAYLRTIENASDDIAVKRIINIPKRGIGATSIARLDAYAGSRQMSFFDACCMADKIPGVGRGAVKIRQFADFILQMREKSRSMLPSALIQEVLEQTKYTEELKLEQTDEALDRLGNIDELGNKAVQYETSFSDREKRRQEALGSDGPEAGSDTELFEDLRKDGYEPTLGGFLQEVALVADIDSLEETDDRVLLMTLHSAKGLEFDNVYLAGMDDGLFPSYHSVSSGETADLEEERRLCYVGITRAKKRLTMTSARMRMLRGEMQWYKTSRFIEEIPKELLDDGRSPADSYDANYKKEEAPMGKEGGRPLTIAQIRHKRERSEFAQKPFYMNTPVSASSVQAGPPEGSVKTGMTALAGIPRGAVLTGELGYDVGDTVRHVKFGTGIVRQIREGGRDREVTVEFEKFGVKKMFAAYAKLVKEN